MTDTAGGPKPRSLRTRRKTAEPITAAESGRHCLPPASWCKRTRCTQAQYQASSKHGPSTLHAEAGSTCSAQDFCTPGQNAKHGLSGAIRSRKMNERHKSASHRRGELGMQGNRATKAGATNKMPSIQKIRTNAWPPMRWRQTRP